MVTALNWLTLWCSAGFCVEDVAPWGFMKVGTVLVKYHLPKEVSEGVND
jgi:hypothetical protein